MKGSSYRDRDYAFGQTMLTLRTTIGLTQAGLAQYLGVSRKAVGEWEGGLTYPKTEHLKVLLALAVEQQAFAAENEEEEIRAFWQAAHQKVLLDETWLAALLRHGAISPIPRPVEETIDIPQHTSPADGPRVDWGDALAVTTFYGRESELTQLHSWVVEDHCRVVSVLGLGGIGKSALAVHFMHQVAEGFEVVIWRSLRDAPACEALLDECLQVLAPQSLHDVSVSLEKRLSFLLECLRRHRVLLVFDNLEVLLEDGQSTGHMRPGYEGYARLLRRIAETLHQSCLILTSREKPSVLIPLEGNLAPVHALRLSPLHSKACERLIAEKEVAGNVLEQTRLIEAYAGNPLALKIVAQTILDLFDGDIAPFLEQGEVVFGEVRTLLDEQFVRLSVMEQMVLRWLAIMREPITLAELQALLVRPSSAADVLEAINSLLRRSLIERGQQPGSLTLQSVVLEYVTRQLVVEASRELERGQLVRLIEHGLIQAHAKNYVRQAQERLLLAPLLERSQSMPLAHAEFEAQIAALFKELRTRPKNAQGYGPANLVALLQMQRANLRDLDLSSLLLRGVYLQGVDMQNTTLADTLIRDSVFTEAFDATWAVATSLNGQYWAAGSKRGDVRVWQAGGQTLHWIRHAHSDIVPALAFSPDARLLASGSVDGMINLWHVASGALLWSNSHANNINSLAFAPDGSLIASGGNDATVRLWDSQSGSCIETLPHPNPVFAVTWSQNGNLLASGDFAGCIRLWAMQKNTSVTCVQLLSGHTNWVRGLAFAPDSSFLASGSYDGTVKLWNVASGVIRQTLVGHSDRVQTVAWSPDGRILASSGLDRSIWLWDVEQGQARAVLHGHTAPVYALTFTPDSTTLLSGGDDGTLRVWDIARGLCVRILQGYAAALYDIDWSPDSTQMVSGGTDALVTIWDVSGKRPPRMLRGHNWVVFGVAWSPDGRRIASSGWDTSIHLWEPTSGALVETQQVPSTFFYGLAWSPDGQHLACGTYLHDVLLWDVTAHSQRWVGRHLPTRFLRVAWSSDGMRLVGGGNDGYVYLWDATHGTLLHKLAKHKSGVTSVAWSPDGTLLASASNGSGELLVWDAHSMERVQALAGQAGIVSAVVWGSSGKSGKSGDVLVSGGSDGMLRWWDALSGECLWVREAHQGMVQSLRCSPDGVKLASCGDDGAILLWDLHNGEHLQTLRRDRPYERLNITGITGLTAAQEETLRALGAFSE